MLDGGARRPPMEAEVASCTHKVFATPDPWNTLLLVTMVPYMMVHLVEVLHSGPTINGRGL